MGKSRKVAPGPSILDEFLLLYNDLIISIAFIICISLTAQILRLLLSTFLKPKSWIRVILQEIVATAEMCITCFELGNVAENYGVEYYGLFYFFSSLWWACTWKEAYASPNNHIEDYFTNDTSAGTAIVVSTVEILTASYAFRFLVHPLWAFKFIPIHGDKLNGVCSADLSVWPLYGSFIEGGGTLVFSVISKIISSKVQSNFVANFLNSLLDATLVIMAYDYSGGYFNPVLATSMQYGCVGASTTDHFVVYWLGGVLGTLIATYGSRYSEESSKHD